MRIAINQSYFIPYAGYFRLLTAVDTFVILDDVQYSHQSWVNRNKLTNLWGDKNWLTIPLKNHSLHTKIKDLEFAEDVEKKWARALGRFPNFKPSKLIEQIKNITSCPTPEEFITQTLQTTAHMLGIKKIMIHASDLQIDPQLKGQDRVLAICKALDARTYINAPGGMHLYKEKDFSNHGIDLKFLTTYADKSSILERLENEEPEAIKKDIDEQTRFIS